MTYLAHSPNPEGQSHVLRDHLCGTAELAAVFGRPFGAEHDAALAGLLHDVGKYAARFQQRLRDPSIRRINHWAAGAVYAMNHCRASLAAYAVDGHHTGLPAATEFAQTRHRAGDPKLWHEHTGCPESIAEMLKRFEQDGLSVPPSSPSVPEKDSFANALRARMVFSCVVDADFLDTERHFDHAVSASRAVPNFQEAIALKTLLTALDAKPSGGDVNQLRRRLLADCLAAAERSPGLFTLTAPTGSGKTLSSLAFALQHAVHHNALLPADDPGRFRRVIVVIPYTSIIEQAAQVFRAILEPVFGPDYVLEHHSAVAPQERLQDEGRDAEDARLRRARLAAENWASPLIVTTSVQFFESLFANRPSDCRKLHNLARSVIVFDEVQTLPLKLVPSLLSAVKILVRDYGVTAVFMTATQPAFGAAKTALPYGWEPVEISSAPSAMADAMRRTRIIVAPPNDRVSWPQLAEQIAGHAQALCVVNTTKDARTLFGLLPLEHRVHLSGRLCPAHRQEKLKMIRQRLADGAPIRLVSTQVIEAGVDVDFPIAFRALGPLDSIVQTAGRCNREGKHPHPCSVIVFRPVDGGTPRGAYYIAAAKTEEFLARHPDAALHQPDTYTRYFTELYSLLGREASEGDPVFTASQRFDFPEAADQCRLIGDEMRAVLIRWGEGAALAEKLRKEQHLTAEECRRAQRYCINLYQGEFQEGFGRWIEQPAKDWNFYVWSSHYDNDLGAHHPGGQELVL